MKRALALSGIAVALVLAFGSWQDIARPGAGSSPAGQAASTTSTAGTTSGSTDLPTAGPYAPFKWTAAIQRAEIWDASDVLAAVRRAQTDGTPDQKWWAHEAVQECFGLMPTIATPPSILPHGKMPAPPTAEQTDAQAELEKRCAEVGTMPMTERRALLKALRDGSEASISEFAQLRRLEMRQGKEPALSPAELSVVQAAFYGEDELLRRQAFSVLYASVDPTGNGALAKEAFLQAVADSVVNPKLSDFEMLESCAVAGICTTPLKPVVPPRPPRQVTLDAQPLSARYADAIARKRPIAEILAIR